MAKDNFERVMECVFRHEGGYVDHPSDPGGATNMGITHTTLAEWRGSPVTKDDVRDLTKDEAREIYRAHYWEKVRGDDLPGGIDLCVMDAAVNSGPTRAARWLQAATGAAQDGVIGPLTIAAARAADAAVAIRHMCNLRITFLHGLSTWPTFGKGWSRRVEDVRASALAMASELASAPVPAPTPAPVREGGLLGWFRSILGRA